MLLKMAFFHSFLWILEEVLILNRVVREGLLEKGTFEQSLEEARE